ncbi:hypothetical protein K491DRAFT_270987 [Lophiostoma macrostomum CBS 122681]|uniref:Uncharacterized protein n=1 Tax=Lophiostoma macrostomum CBS 122681 TaxID=1314788 RepID=A0A6A6SJQ3_9PLEO|nr:hypothetical protein K491DRAFT_270987 [Lophiostoma macrostomum CBS 122681]
MSFHWDGTAPGAGNNWWHSQNPCWPTAIASSDEGYPLLTDDYYYTTHPHKAEAEQRKAMYVDPPPQAILDAAKDKYKDVVLPTKRSLQLGPASLFQLTDGDLALDDGNSTRRLTEDDLPNVAVLDCRDRFCKEELAALEGESGDVVLIPGAPLPTLPPVVEAVATKTSAPLSMQTVVRRSSGF